MPGSWRRSRLSEIDSSLTRTLRASSSGGYFIFRSMAVEIPPAEAGTGDPGPGARAGMRAPEARGLPEGTRRKPDTDGRADQEKVRYGGAPLRAPRQNLFLNFEFAASCGSTNAGGEDFLILRTMGKAGSNPAFDVTYRGSGLARAVPPRVPVLLPRSTCVGIIDNRYRQFPSVPFAIVDVRRRTSARRW